MEPGSVQSVPYYFILRAGVVVRSFSTDQSTGISPLPETRPALTHQEQMDAKVFLASDNLSGSLLCGICPSSLPLHPGRSLRAIPSTFPLSLLSRRRSLSTRGNL